MMISLPDDLSLKIAELGFSGTEFLWDPEKKQRANELTEEFGELVPIITQYIWQGGSRDLGDFFANFGFKFDYSIKMGWLPSDANRERYREEVKKTMAQVALSDVMPYVYCPFMKTRSINLKKAFSLPESRKRVEEIMCYMTQGIALPEFSMTEKHVADRRDYLIRIGILP